MKKINIGCASRLLDGYINIDRDSLEDIKNRYPELQIDDDKEFLQADVFDLPFEENSLDEIRGDGIVEHFSFKEEPKFFHTAQKLLKKGGLLNFSVPDFEDTVKKWIEAKDEWRDFFRDDEESKKKQHWFGQYSYSTDSRWGYLTACIFGNQTGDGQFHKNAYTESKIKAILEKLEFNKPSLERFLWKGDRDSMIRVKATKK
jgi:predicted SAM-dependent methyltransferase